MKKLVITMVMIIANSLSAEEIKPYIVYLKPGTILTRLSDKSEFTLPKGQYVRVFETNYKKRDLFYVYDDKGKPKYETTAKGIVEVDQDYALLPKIRADVVYPPPSEFKLSDKTRNLESQFNLHVDNLQTDNFTSIYSDNISSVTAPRLELRTMYTRPDFPISMGGTINYQSTSWQNEVDRVNLTIISFGPLVQYDFYKHEKQKVAAILGAEFAPIYRTSTNESEEEYSGMLYDIGVEGTWDTEYGLWSLGSHYRQHTISLEKTNRVGLNPVQERLSIKSLGVMIGYKYNWSL